MNVGGEPKRAGGRSLARLAAVQALYQQEHQHLSVDDILEEFLSYRFGTPVLEEKVHTGDKTFFVALVKGVAEEAEKIDTLLVSCLSKEWALERLDPVLRAILRAGLCELLVFPEISARVVLNEYIELAKAFFEEKEPPFVNGLLHRASEILRPQAGPFNSLRMRRRVSSQSSSFLTKRNWLC
jgi:N utilization substance protein B